MASKRSPAPNAAAAPPAAALPSAASAATAASSDTNRRSSTACLAFTLGCVSSICARAACRRHTPGRWRACKLLTWAGIARCGLAQSSSWRLLPLSMPLEQAMATCLMLLKRSLEEKNERRRVLHALAPCSEKRCSENTLKYLTRPSQNCCIQPGSWRLLLQCAAAAACPLPLPVTAIAVAPPPPSSPQVLWYVGVPLEPSLMPHVFVSRCCDCVGTAAFG